MTAELPETSDATPVVTVGGVAAIAGAAADIPEISATATRPPASRIARSFGRGGFLVDAARRLAVGVTVSETCMVGSNLLVGVWLARCQSRERRAMGPTPHVGAAADPMLGRGHYLLGFDEAAADRIAGQLDTVAHPELLEHVRAVALDRFFADHELLGDLAVGVAFSD